MILPWKKNDNDKPAFVPSPEKAKMFLERAAKAQSQSSFDVALYYFANAVKVNPQEIAIHEAMYACGKSFCMGGGKPASGVDVKSLDGPTPQDRLAVAELYWMRDLNNVDRALDMLHAAVKADQIGFGAWAGPKVFNLLSVSFRDKPNKKMLLRAKNLFVEVNSWEEAKLCIEQALVIDPSDIQLDREFKQILANRAIVASGFDRADGGTGNFRENVRDLDKQRAMEEQDALTGSAGSEDRNLARTKADYDANPTIPDNIQKYCTSLRRMGTPEHEAIAYRTYLAAFESLKEYRFRMAAGDIKLMRAMRQLNVAEETAKGPQLMQRLNQTLLEFVRQFLICKLRNIANAQPIIQQTVRSKRNLVAFSSNSDNMKMPWDACKSLKKNPKCEFLRLTCLANALQYRAGMQKQLANSKTRSQRSMRHRQKESNTSNTT